MDAAAASRVRQRIWSLRQERDRLEEELLEIRTLLQGSLVAHYSLSGGQRRRNPAFYVFRRQEGRRRLIYVRKADLERVRRHVDAYRRHRDGLRRLRGMGEDILEAYKSLQEVQEEGLPQ